MKFDILEKQNENTVVITNDFKTGVLKKYYSKNCLFEIEYNCLNLGTKLYGNNKEETKKIQSANCKTMIKIYRKIAKIIKISKRHKINFNNTFYIKNLTEKKNNNDFQLKLMLDLRFNNNVFTRYTKSILYACKYLDNELKTENMCDFRDNKCIKHRYRNFDRNTGCCPSNCKFLDCKGCKTQNLSCKLILCDYLIEKGFYFSPTTLPILAIQMNYIERIFTWGMFFKSTKKTYGFMRLVRVLEIFTILLCGFIIFTKIF